ncbi:MAG: DNA methyltransferase, partial [Halobacteria archaeon]
MVQIKLDNTQDEDWTFKEANTHEYTHGLHPYPARMCPQIARKLIKLYSKPKDIIFDPFCGSGTVLVEAKLAGR